MPEDLFDPRERPTRESIERHVTHLEGVWRQGHKAMERADSYYFQTNNIWDNLDKAKQLTRPQFHSGRAVALVDHAVDAYLAFEPRWHRRPAGEGGEHQKAADALEKGLAEVVRDTMSRQPSFGPKVNGKQLARHNYTQLYVGLDTEYLQVPVRKEGEGVEDFDRREWEWELANGMWNPLVLTVPAPGEVLMEPWRKVPRVAIRNITMRAYELAHEMKQQGKRRGVEIAREYTVSGDGYEQLHLWEWWTTAYKAMMFKGGELLWVERNPWGIMPFIQAFGGSSDFPVGKEADPAWYIQQAMLFRVMEDLKLRDQRIVAEHELLMERAYAHIGFSGGNPVEAAKLLEGDILPGRKEDWWVREVVQLPQGIFEHGQVLDDDIEKATYSLQAAGFRQPGTDTATQQIMLSEATNRTFKANVRQLEDLYTIAGSNLLKLWARVAEEYDEGEREEGRGRALRVGKHPLRVSDMKGQYHIQATFEQVDPVVALQEKQAAMQELEAGLIDEDTYYRIARYEDPSGIRKGRYRDLIRKMPEVADLGVIAALREAGFQELADQKEKELRQRKATQGQQLVNPQGQPIGATNGGVSPEVLRQVISGRAS